MLDQSDTNATGCRVLLKDTIDKTAFRRHFCHASNRRLARRCWPAYGAIELSADCEGRMLFLGRITIIHWLAAVSLLTTIALLVLPGRNPDNTQPIETLLPAHTTTSIAQSVQVIFTSRQADPAGDDQLEFVLLNATNSPVYYPGYEPSSSPDGSTGHMRPQYEKKLKHGDNWQDKRLGWCGNGATRRRLMPGQAGLFRTSQLSDEPIVQIGVSWSPTKDDRYRDEDVAWSSVIERP